MLLQTTQELNNYVTFDEDDLPAPLVTEVARLEAQLLRPLLGDELGDWLREQYADDPALATTDSLAGQLLRRVQAPLARLGLSGVLDELQVTVSNTGIQIMSTQTHKTAFNWQVSRLRRTLETKGYLDLNALLQWLEDNYAATDNPAVLLAWGASPAGRAHRRQLLTSAAEFSRFVDIQDSWRTFRALKNLIRLQESLLLAPVLGFEFLTELRTQVLTRTLDDENEQLLEQYVRPALAHLTLARAVPELGLRLGGDGIELMIARLDDENGKEADAGLDQLLAARARDAEQTAGVYLAQLRQHLNREASATRFPTYFASATYQSPSTPQNPLNTLQSRVYRFL